MNQLGERISYHNHEDYTTLIISGQTDSWKTNVMLAWFIGWLFCGLSVVYSIYNYEFDPNQQTFLLVFMVFWAYFLFKITRVLLWRKFGMEFIKIDNDRISIKKSILLSIPFTDILLKASCINLSASILFLPFEITLARRES